MKVQPQNINPDLWERFLIKKGYDGVFRKYGCTFYAYHTPMGFLKVCDNGWKDKKLFS
jgi:hypothetical protein